MGISRCPLASPVARWQASRQSFVTNLRHELTELDDLNRFLLPELDGSRDRAALLAMVEELAAQGRLQVPAREGKPSRKVSPEPAILTEIVDYRLNQLAHLALLVG
jgi:methyltransferase-like protein